MLTNSMVLIDWATYVLQRNLTKRNLNIKLKNNFNSSSDYFLKLENIKEELLVIVYHYGTVNMY